MRLKILNHGGWFIDRLIFVLKAPDGGGCLGCKTVLTNVMQSPKYRDARELLLKVPTLIKIVIWKISSAEISAKEAP